MAVVLVGAALGAACGGDDDESADSPSIEVRVAPDVPSIIKISDVTCRRVDDQQLVAAGIISSASEEEQYASIQVRFLDGDGVRVELASDSVSSLRVGESARWDATTYTAGASDVERCEVTATVS
jgi:hypothetical protein